jgi:hypothetical protein
LRGDIQIQRQWSALALTDRTSNLCRVPHARPLQLPGLPLSLDGTTPQSKAYGYSALEMSALTNVDYPAGLTARVYFTAGPSHGAGGLLGYWPVGSMEEHVGQASPQSLRSTSKMHAHIRSTPAGADIFVDNGYVGTTPLDIDLTCCWHDVTLIQTGRKPWTRRVRIAAGEDLKITAHLRK